MEAREGGYREEGEGIGNEVLERRKLKGKRARGSEGGKKRRKRGDKKKKEGKEAEEKKRCSHFMNLFNRH